MRVSTRDNNFINSKGDYAGISPDKGRYKAFYDPQSGEIAVALE